VTANEATIILIAMFTLRIEEKYEVVSKVNLLPPDCRQGYSPQSGAGSPSKGGES
jgi:hypothetical protein